MQLSHTIPQILRPPRTGPVIVFRARQLMPLIILAGAFYGAVMGSFGGVGPDRFRQMLYSAMKVPMLLGLSFLLALPSFFILNTLLGLRGDFRAAIRALAAAEAGLVITLASLAPFVPLWYASSADYPSAILFNGAMFAIATLAGQVLLRRFYQPLIDRDPRHRSLLGIWTILYAFIAIQMAWVLRPFIGGPGEATTFFRHDAWGNAYVMIWNLLWSLVR